MKKPSWFRLIDFVTMAGLGLFTVAVAVYASVVGVSGPHAKQGMALIWTVAGLFFAIWARFAWERKKWLDTFVWLPTYGLMVQPENWTLPPAPEIDAAVKATIDAWTPYFPAAKILAEQVNWIWFKKGLNESAMNPAHKTVKGLTIFGSHECEVDYDLPTDLLSKTAFRHELGHVIMGNATGQWDNDTHHAFMREHGLL